MRKKQINRKSSIFISNLLSYKKKLEKININDKYMNISFIRSYVLYSRKIIEKYIYINYQ